MSDFERLHPSVQHHVVNTLGWSSLRAHQEQAIAPILNGAHVLVQAPTAGGKTEAALLPVLSRMLDEDWDGLTVLYLCPIKALLNNLEHRIGHLSGLFGRRVGLWHGDVSPSARQRILRDPPDVLLTTPESLEVMLVSRRVDHDRLFRRLRVVIVDEVHAFAGDDRGWHLYGVLARLDRLAQAPLQRVALSATLANADDLLTHLAPRAEDARAVVAAEAPPASEADVALDFVGSTANAALVLSRLYRGEKRLVFCDSRSQAEELASMLRAYRVDTFVSHSSLSPDERRRAEDAFSIGRDCVIVATSTLELGIDVGDLDRVVQLDAPFTVASFLQRLGRTGRRAGERRNCLFLATSEAALLRGAGLIRLWQEGFVEPVVPPPLPYHVLAQQLLALVLQEGGTTRVDAWAWLQALAERAAIGREGLDALLDHLLATGVLFDDGGVVGLGPEGERRYGRKNFLELFSVFLSPPLFSVFHGPTALGQVHEDSFRDLANRPAYLSLGGRGWHVTHVDWGHRRAYVEPVEQTGRSRWLGAGQPMHLRLCRAVQAVLAAEAPPAYASRRAAERLAELQANFAWVEPGATTLVRERRSAKSIWWTFAGDRYNTAVASALHLQGRPATADSFSVRISVEAGLDVDAMWTAAREAVRAEAMGVDAGHLEQIKFSESLPEAQQQALLLARYSVVGAAAQVSQEAVRHLSVE